MAWMRISSDILEWIAAVLFCVVVLAALSRSVGVPRMTCPQMLPSTVGRSITAAPPAADRETDAILRDMLLHD
jgi:hypothetical protein